MEQNLLEAVKKAKAGDQTAFNYIYENTKGASPCPSGQNGSILTKQIGSVSGTYDYEENQWNIFADTFTRMHGFVYKDRTGFSGSERKFTFNGCQRQSCHFHGSLQR